jgi:mevalonate kinase
MMNQTEETNSGVLASALTGKYDQRYYGHGKVLLSGEYFVLEGAKGLAVPTRLGQSMAVKHSPSFSPKLTWRSFDVKGEKWFDATFEFWRFDCVDQELTPDVIFLQKLLRQARLQNKHFLRDEVDVLVETQLEFPLDWGLGSSSTLIYNMAQWAYVSPFEMLFQTYGGSGYDIACAQSEGPIVYEKNAQGPHWSPITFDPVFKDQLYFVHLGRKQDSRQAVAAYIEGRPYAPELIAALSEITTGMAEATTLADFGFLIQAHERLVGEALKKNPVKAERFTDYWGEVKSLGAWGGDFVLVTSERGIEETRAYFAGKGLSVVLPFSELALLPDKNPHHANLGGGHVSIH